MRAEKQRIDSDIVDNLGWETAIFFIWDPI